MDFRLVANASTGQWLRAPSPELEFTDMQDAAASDREAKPAAKPRVHLECAGALPTVERVSQVPVLNLYFQLVPSAPDKLHTLIRDGLGKFNQPLLIL